MSQSNILDQKAGSAARPCGDLKQEETTIGIKTIYLGCALFFRAK